MISATVLETMLAQGFQQQAEWYAEGLPFAEQAAQALCEGRDAQDALQPMLQFLEKAANVDREMAEARRLWREQGRRPGPELQAILQRVTGLIQRLGECVVRAEQGANAHKESLGPQLDALARAARMRRAYGRG